MAVSASLGREGSVAQLPVRSLLSGRCLCICSSLCFPQDPSTLVGRDDDSGSLQDFNYFVLDGRADCSCMATVVIAIAPFWLKLAYGLRRSREAVCGH